MAAVYSENAYVICQVALDINSTEKDNEWLELLKGSKGLETVLEFCDLHGESKLSKYLATTSQAIHIHRKCRHKFTSKRRLEQGSTIVDEGETHESNPKLLLSSIPVFEFKKNCFLCCGPVVIDLRHPENSSVRDVTTVEMKEKVLEKCDERMDVWGLEVKARLALCADLPAVHAVYHTNCHRDFLNGRQCSKVRERYSTTGWGPGRPQYLKKADAFLRMCEWLEDS